MVNLILATLCGVSFAPILFKKLDVWHAQGMWVQIGIMMMFSWSFYASSKPVLVKNRGIALLHFWVGGFTAVICFIAQIHGKYDLEHFLLYFNFICILVFYNLVIRHINRDDIVRIFSWLRYVIIITMFICVLQYFKLSQFFGLIAEDRFHNNLVSGFIGNGTHLSGFLASTIPLFLLRNKREDWLCLVLMGLILSVSGTSTEDIAISGFIVAIAVILYYYRNIYLIMSCVVAGIFAWRFLPNNFYSLNGRTTIWTEYFKLFHQMPITGPGLGTINRIYRSTAVPNARHLHMEFFHYTFELGIIGGVLILNMVKEFFEIKPYDNLERCLKACVIGFLVSSCFNYPSHLWLPSSWAAFFYACIYCIKNEELLFIGDKNAERYI